MHTHSPHVAFRELQRETNRIENSVADTKQIGGTHYKEVSVQPWTAMEAWMSPEEFRGFLRGNAIKYLARSQKKGGVQDLEKARHYLDKLIEQYPPAGATPVL